MKNDFSGTNVVGFIGPKVDRGDGGGDDGDMLERIEKLEKAAEKANDRLVAIERDVAVIKSNYATKSDVSDAKNSVIMWVVSAILLAQVLPLLLKNLGP